jgi:hypothetical protein
MVLTTRFDSAKEAAGSKQIVRTINLGVETDAANRITSCVSLAEMTDGLWRRTLTNNNNIAFTAPSSGGFVGIGTTAPAAALHVANGSIRTEQVSSAGLGNGFEISDGGNQRMSLAYNAISKTVELSAGATPQGNISMIANGRRLLTLETNSWTQGDVLVGNNEFVKMADQWGPRLLIGGDQSNNSDEVYLQRNNRALDETDVYFQIGDNAVDGVGVTDRLIIGAQDNLTNTWHTRFLLESTTGNIGIGTETPIHKVDIVGNLRVAGTAQSCVIGAGSGANCSSDARLKENITPIQNALAKIMRLRGVEFDWNSRAQQPGRHDVGVIAQEVEKVFPSMVIENPDTGLKLVDYSALVSPLIESVRELYGICADRDREAQQAQREADSHARALRQLREAYYDLKAENAKLAERLGRIEKKMND